MIQLMGKHYFVNLYGCPFGILNDEHFLRQCVTEACTISKVNLLQMTSKVFSPHGVTILGLLSESHISIHTWPERGEAAVDFFTCGKARPEIGCDIIINKLECKRHKIGQIER